MFCRGVQHSLDTGERVHEDHVDERVGVHRRRVGPAKVQVEVRLAEQFIRVDEVGGASSN